VTALARPRVKYRPILSSERVPNIKKSAIVRQKTKIWSWAADDMCCSVIEVIGGLHAIFNYCRF
jgi:hypothetical protein